MRNSDSIGLLDLLQEKTACSYISDLHDMRYAKRVKKAVQCVNPDAYSEKTWCDAVHYIMGNSADYATTEEAIASLLEYLDQHIK